MAALNIKPAACALALVTTSLIALPANANKDMYDWIQNSVGKVIDIPAGNDFDITIASDTDIDPGITSIVFDITYNPTVVTSEGFVVNAHTTPFSFSDLPNNDGTPDHSLILDLRLQPGDSWENALSDLADLTFRGITRDDSVTADIALRLATGDENRTPVPLTLQDPADAQHFFITPNATPEPTTLALLSLTSIPLLLRKRRE